MVKPSKNSIRTNLQNLNPDTWLDSLPKNYQTNALIQHAAQLAYLAGEKNQDWQQGLDLAEILLPLEVDSELLAAAILYPAWEHADLKIEDIQEALTKNVATLISGVNKLKLLSELHQAKIKNNAQIEHCRKMLLAMAEDLRVVLLKLAERLLALRNAKTLPSEAQKKLGEEIFAIYAPLANRLGLGQLKWEMEDLAFRATEPELYKKIAKQLDMKRLERETFIEEMIALLEKNLKADKLSNFKLMGRAKHIYSIHRKLTRKGSKNLKDLFDISAVRILVNSLEDCYCALDSVQQNFEMIAQEFDDYISAPKPNGYRSIHTAVIGPKKHIVEIQIRTHQMHTESELGIAAHWNYKEGGKGDAAYQNKIAWLREILSWQKEVGNPATQSILDDCVYALTPEGDIIDLPKGATPLDFAYAVHTSVGHRCKGAKVNGHIVPLTSPLKMGDRVEILTLKEPRPSRDWMNPKSGYLFTTRARAKVASWFRKENLEEKTSVIGAPKILEATPKKPETKKEGKKKAVKIFVEGSSQLLTHLARCCNPEPGDDVAGYISQRHGVAIHKTSCASFLARKKLRPERVLIAEYQ